MAYINPAPGTSSAIVLKLDTATSESDLTLGATPLTVPALQDITVNAANDVFTWSQLDSTAKKQIATTSTNSISMNLVVDPDSFFGTTLASVQSDTVAAQGLLGLSRNKTLVTFSLKFQEGGATDKFIKGTGYITGLAPTVSADAPVWVTPITITVTGEYTASATE
jgi:hypothetical protein